MHSSLKAVNLEIHPLYMMIPPVLATSMAFMLPIATPPNAIAFGYGHLKIIDTVSWRLPLTQSIVFCLVSGLKKVYH